MTLLRPMKGSIWFSSLHSGLEWVSALYTRGVSCHWLASCLGNDKLSLFPFHATETRNEPQLCGTSWLEGTYPFQNGQSSFSWYRPNTIRYSEENIRIERLVHFHIVIFFRKALYSFLAQGGLNVLTFKETEVNCSQKGMLNYCTGYTFHLDQNKIVRPFSPSFPHSLYSIGSSMVFIAIHVCI